MNKPLHETNKTPEKLISALRQFQNNDCSWLVTGYDKSETEIVIKELEAQVADLISERDRLLKQLNEVSK